MENDSTKMRGMVRRQLFDGGGNCLLDETQHNTITTKGKELASGLLCGIVTTPVTAIAIGTGTGGTTSLNTEIPNNTYGGGRVAAGISQTTVTTTKDTAQWANTFAFTGAYTITEEGLFDSAAIGAGNMLAYQSFGAITVASGYTLVFTHKITLA